MTREYGPGTGLEILASLVFFVDSLNYWHKVDIFGDLLEYLWESEADSDITALAGLAVTLVSDDVLLAVWPRVGNVIEAIERYCLERSDIIGIGLYDL